MSIHKEISFEREICEHLGAHGWLYAEGDAARYDRTLALYPDDVIAWVRQTQPDEWEALEKSYGAGATQALLRRVRDQLEQRGTLEVLRQGIEMLGVRTRLHLAQFRPALGANSGIMARYQANRLRVVRQVRYSRAETNDSIDLVLFVNGIPIATAELKTDFTQNVEDAIAQYRADRNPRPQGRDPEPLLSFPGGALVHFAVSNLEVHMATRLEGAATRFLPFNQGNRGGAGNPPNPNGHPTAYLWEDVWERDGWLEILGRYMVAQRDARKQVQAILFPRYHQLDATRKLVAAVRAAGAGGSYLVQHSAGSGKTNSIAWTAHFLADLHDEHDHKVFDTVLVVSDRNVIDTQLQAAIYEFERTPGVVATITGEGASKSAELAEALAAGKKIVVSTIQTFPFALKTVRDLAATKGKRFAVLADEAHSSQTGETSKQLRAVLTDAEVQALADGGEVSTEDLLLATMATRADESDGITYVAFTATPKSTTIERFGTRPDPSRKPAPDNVPQPFHVYSMRQAIEERFILDVLRNYVTYRTAFRLAHEGREMDDREVERGTAMKGIMAWVRLHPYNIAQKVQVVVEHYREAVAPLLDGRAKAMVVVGSRVEAVRWQLAMQRYIADRGYPLRTLVAFSGEVKDPDSGPDPFTERSTGLNPNLLGREIRDAFHTDEFQLLLVANKFQTGFDEPLLCGMYVDRRLAGIQAVQTLSRLNRAHPGKDTTYVLDFVNEADDILSAFQAYYTTATLTSVTDPNLVFDLRAKLDAAGHYDEGEVDRVVEAELRPGAQQRELVAAIAPVADRLLRRYTAAQQAQRDAEARHDSAAAEAARGERDALEQFRADIGTYVRLYTFLSQIFDYGSTGVEKRAIFFRRLLPLLEFGREREGVDLSKVLLTHHTLKRRGGAPMQLQPEAVPIQPMTGAGTRVLREQERVYLREMIARVNELFQGDLTEEDKLVYVGQVLKGKLLESETLIQQAASNTKEQFANSPDLKSELLKAIIDALDAHGAMSTQALESESVRRGLQDVLLNHANLYESLRQKAA
ncbi:type I restriction endonuclease subunit R [Longimicrobium sp.]|uniref:type I restriction endonuclease subunit R n=1 Tax=Longimicrobium sp. TaxID=2029185 RepID=UPI002C1C6D54|nr:type I restriction endonuclease [Longimicrobium sp.]HSU15399.1 type I restriction endonuclease [Longimicrobium sp.]